jgi:hypothetical protein
MPGRKLNVNAALKHPGRYARNLRIAHLDSADGKPIVLIEGRAADLRLLGELLLAVADAAIAVSR